MVRLGISFSGGDSIADIIRNSKLAEDRNFEIIWWSEDFFLRDGISPLAVIALNTNRIKLGTGVISPYVHHPATIATTIATLDEISKKRMILGLGAGVSHWVRDQMGINQPRPVVAIRECIEIFKGVMEGKSITFEGEVFRCQEVKLGFEPPRTRIPFYLAATGPRMLRLSGEIADGAIPGGAGASVKATQHSIRSIYDGAKRAGRSTSEVDIHQFVISSVSNNSERAKELVKEFVAWMIGSGGLSNKSLLLDGFDTKDVLPIVQAINKNDPREASRCVTSRMVDTFAAAGTPKEFRQRIMSYVDAGVKCVVIVPTGSQADINVTIEEASRLVDSERRY